MEITWDLVQRTGIISDVKWIQSVIIYIGQGKSGNNSSLLKCGSQIRKMDPVISEYVKRKTITMRVEKT